MNKEYVVSTKQGAMYRSHIRIPLQCNMPDIAIYSAVKYSDAKKFYSLRWATHIAKYLSKHSHSLYYVYTLDYKSNGKCLMKIVDDTINDKLIESNRQLMKEIDSIIGDWKGKNNI